jgi:hypothetical protein
MKRQGENRQIQKHELDSLEDEDDEGPGSFSRADDGVLASRKIVKAKR